jgi:hypothetical protein
MFEILQAYKDRANPETDSHKKWLDNVKAKTEFKAVIQITKKAYVGAAEGIDSLQQRILKLTQHLYNSKTAKMEFLSVQQLNKQYQNHLSEIDGKDPTEGNDLPNLAQSFYQALTPRIKEEIVDRLPNINPVNFQENLAAYNSFLEHAKKAEKKIKLIFTIAWSASNTRSTTNMYRNPTGGPRSFLTRQQESQQANEQEE